MHQGSAAHLGPHKARRASAVSIPEDAPVGRSEDA